MNNGKFFAGLALGALVGGAIVVCAQQQRSQIEKRRV